MAGWKWIRGFLRRNPRISLRTPENTSLARAQAFNKNNIQAYFKALSAVMEQNRCAPEHIYNVDESGMNTVQTRPQKVFATKGRKQVGTISSAERGQHFSVVCAVNAIGTFIPPAFIFPRKRLKNELIDEAPTGSVAFCQEKGWMSGEIFIKWLKHFVHYTKPSKENKVVLLLDGHSSHKGLEVLEYAKDNGIVIFCFPAHCTHRVQPLDVAFFGPLQVYYDQEVQTWLKQNPGRTVTHYQVAGLFKKAYLKAATPMNAINGFLKTGIYPLNSNIFEDWMFAPSLTTDQKENIKPGTEISFCSTENLQGEENIINQPCNNKDNAPDSIPTTNPSTSKDLDSVVESLPPVPIIAISSSKNLEVSIQKLSPLPVALTKSDVKKKRKRGKVGLLNSTPDIQELKAKENEKLVKERNKLARKAKRRVVENFEENDENSETSEDSDQSDAACLYCNELYSRSRAKEFWIRCQICYHWCHAECAGVDRRSKRFICEICI